MVVPAIPPAIDEEGGDSRITNTPSRTSAKGTTIPGRAPINLEDPEADLNLVVLDKIVINFLESINSTSGAAVLEPAPAALGAPPREASASVFKN